MRGGGEQGWGEGLTRAACAVIEDKELTTSYVHQRKQAMGIVDDINRLVADVRGMEGAGMWG